MILVATVYFKALLAVMTRNAIVVSPHPVAKDVCADAILTLAIAAQSAGAPPGLIHAVENPTIPLIDHFMTSKQVNLIVATGGPAVVEAAYRSGNPAIGVRSGNAPVLVDDTCDFCRAAKSIVGSEGFDNLIFCTNESTILAFESIADALPQQLKTAKAHICKPDRSQTSGSFSSAMPASTSRWSARTPASLPRPQASERRAPKSLLRLWT
jgi:acyl-CoA reductase-like NAD-dependent aldehyde dehydrogenase